MKILWIKSDFLLPADSGGKIRSLELLTELAKHDDITFLSYVPPGHDGRWGDPLRGQGIRVESIPLAEKRKGGFDSVFRVLSKLFSFRPSFVRQYRTVAMTERIGSLIASRQFDAVVCDFLAMAWCAECVVGVPKVLFEHNVETLIQRRSCAVETRPLRKLYFALETVRMERFERQACSRFDEVLTVSGLDGELLAAEFGLKHYVVIPTGVDTARFHPLGREIANRLVFCGSMGYIANVDAFWWFYRSILPLIREEIPGVTFTVVGRGPGPDMEAVGNEDQSIKVTGTVADVRPEVGAAQLSVVPLRIGGGTRIKIYEAMAMRKCVVSTSIGAEGLPLTDGVNIVIADHEAEFAKKVKELLRDDVKRNGIAEAGFRLVREKYSWSRAAGKLHAALSSLARKQSLRGNAPRLR